MPVPGGDPTKVKNLQNALPLQKQDDAVNMGAGFATPFCKTCKTCSSLITASRPYLRSKSPVLQDLVLRRGGFVAASRVAKLEEYAYIPVEKRARVRRSPSSIFKQFVKQDKLS